MAHPRRSNSVWGRAGIDCQFPQANRRTPSSVGDRYALTDVTLVTRLTEYRTRLVADVVTGKLDVREAAAALPEVDPLAAEDHLDDTAEATDQPAFDHDEELSELEY